MRRTRWPLFVRNGLAGRASWILFLTSMFLVTAGCGTSTSSPSLGLATSNADASRVSGGFVLDPSEFSCATPSPLTITVHFPPSLAAGEMLSESIDGKLVGQPSAWEPATSDYGPIELPSGGESRYVLGADGTWTTVATIPSSHVQVACSKPTSNDLDLDLSVGTHAIQV